MSTGSKGKLQGELETRLPVYVFDLPIQEIRRGYRSDVYFWREKLILERDHHNPVVVIQVFQKKEAVLCGVDEAIAILRVGTGHYADLQKAHKLFDRLMNIKMDLRKYRYTDKTLFLSLIGERMEVEDELDSIWASEFDQLKITALRDGDEIEPYESVMHIEGPAASFAHLETVSLGALARRTKIASNVHKCVQAAQGKPVIFFGARFDHFSVQGGDGYAASVGGAEAVSTDAGAEWWGSRGIGTIPHALIACYRGDTAQATYKFYQHIAQGTDIRVIALVDYHNDSVGTSLEVARKLKDILWAVRLDTSDTMVDRCLWEDMMNFDPRGVNVRLVEKVRAALDRDGFSHVKIIVSGGFNPDKIALFEEKKAPLDIYAIGSSLFEGKYDFTGDVVMVDSEREAKKGREYRPIRPRR
ncbi:MAG: quinolinate phosphoribosyl transferase [Deltaproteobacteria bacterium]|nr:MAG: quinolinate phosphoribosyl transferase [Deltaproteobacteria bacterium]